MPASNKSLIDSDIEGLIAAYKAGRPVVYGTTMYIPGTRRPTDLLDDALIGSLAFGNSFAVRDADRLFMRSTVDRVVGHSLGGAVAARLGKRQGVVSVGYGSPVRNDINYADVRDPVGVFVRSNNINNNGMFHHGVGGYVKPIVYGLTARRK